MSVLNIATTSWITSACEGMNISQKMCLLSWVAREVPVYGPGRERSKPPVLGDEGTTNSSQRFYVDILVVQFLRIHLTYEHWKKIMSQVGQVALVGTKHTCLDLILKWPEVEWMHILLQESCRKPATNMADFFKMIAKEQQVWRWKNTQLSSSCHICLQTNTCIYIYTRYHPCMVYIHLHEFRWFLWLTHVTVKHIPVT